MSLAGHHSVTLTPTPKGTMLSQFPAFENLMVLVRTVLLIEFFLPGRSSRC